MKKGLLGETRFYFAQCVFNTCCQYSAYDRYNNKRAEKQNLANWISAVSVLIMGLTIFGWESCQSILKLVSLMGLVSTITSLIFELYNRDDLTEIMCYHKQAAEEYKNLRDRFMDIIRRIKSGSDDEDLESALQKCLFDYGMLGRYSLPTTTEDYKSAQAALGLKGVGESFTWHSYEIDKFLPDELRENIQDKE